MIRRKKHVRRTLLLSLLASACCFPGYAGTNDISALTQESNSIEGILQNRKITGIVKDNFGPVIGANVSIKGTTIGAITDMDGKFSLNAPESGMLVVSS